MNENQPIGFSHGEYTCPWCKERFSYNDCNPQSRMLASKEWNDHVDSKHKNEYFEIQKRKPFDIDVTIQLQLGRLPDEIKARKLKTLKEQYQKKLEELENLKKQIEVEEKK